MNSYIHSNIKTELCWEFIIFDTSSKSPYKAGHFLKRFSIRPESEGQLISKCTFGVFTFFQKTNKNKSTSSRVEFVHSFFGRNVGLKKSFRICLTFRNRIRYIIFLCLKSPLLFAVKSSSIITLMYTARDLDLDGSVGFGSVFVKSQVALLRLLGRTRTHWVQTAYWSRILNWNSAIWNQKK